MILESLLIILILIISIIYGAYKNMKYSFQSHHSVFRLHGLSKVKVRFTEKKF